MYIYNVCILILIYISCLFVCFSHDFFATKYIIGKLLEVSLMIAEILFLLGIEYREGDSKLQCGIVAGLLHYTFLAAFAWMALEGIHLYLSLNQVFNVDNR